MPDGATIMRHYKEALDKRRQKLLERLSADTSYLPIAKELAKLGDLSYVQLEQIVVEHLCRDRQAVMEKALRVIAQFQDEGANRFLIETGSYLDFDEPSSVRVAREALKELGIHG